MILLQAVICRNDLLDILEGVQCVQRPEGIKTKKKKKKEMKMEKRVNLRPWKSCGNSSLLKLLRKSAEVLEEAAWGGGGVSIPGGVQEMWRCGTEGHG